MPVNVVGTLPCKCSQKAKSLSVTGQDPGSGGVQEQARQIHLQYRCTLLAVSLENLLLTKRTSNYFDQNSISLLALPHKYETIAFVDCFNVRGKSCC